MQLNVASEGTVLVQALRRDDAMHQLGRAKMDTVFQIAKSGETDLPRATATAFARLEKLEAAVLAVLGQDAEAIIRGAHQMIDEMKPVIHAWAESGQPPVA